MAKTIRLSVLFVVSFVICGIGFFNIVQANTAVPSGSITATYNPVTKELIANGSFKDGQTSPSGDVRNGFALFINGATPLVEGSALDPIINLVPAPTTPTGVWSYFRTLITTPSKICVTMYDVQMSKLGHTGGHSDNPDGPDRNGGNQNSFDQNNQSFSFQVIDGKLDLNKDGSAGNADDGTLLGKTIIDGKVDINGSGTINSADDGAFNGKAVIDGEIDMNGSGTITNADDGSFADDPSTCVVPTIICTDNDNDGYFVEGGQCGQIDCNDSNASINPGATEVCNNINDDCDIWTDEGFLWNNKGQSCTSGLGICANSGVYVCDGFNPSGQTICSATPGQAGIETCNNLDDDCDGTTDESLTRATSCGTGVCSQNTGTETCSIGIWGQNTCNPFGGATTETCDGSLDQDCDGQIDEGCACTDGTTQPCGSSNVGACQYGIQTCSGGQWGTCVGSVEPTTETCDGTDNDCDGTTDEGYNLGIICSVGIGSCERTGAYVCSGGTSVCSATPGQPGAEVCNNADDDCDGTIDEGLTQTTYCGLGVCSQNTGYETCSAGAWGGNTCNPYYGASTEICDGSLDQNCNGTIDEGCACTDGNTQPCGSSNVGACQYGTQTCSGGQWSTCIGSIEPTTETCDGVDNDCDGTTDESLTRATSCGLGACTGNTGYETCSAGTWGQDTCNPLNGATTEICDGIDNNCDGTIDEGITRPTTCGLGICSQNTGNETCVLGIWGGDSCNPYLGAIAEVCSDSLDNDCDGNVDENCQQPQPPSGVFGNFGGGQFVLQYTLNATKTGTGSGTVTATGIDCGSDCSESYNENTMVALTATADSNSDFIGWSGDCSGTVCQVTMSFNRNVSAQFNARGEVAGAATSTEPGEILGESTTCYLYLLEYIKYGANNNPVEVKKLQTFLNENMGTNLPITGIYDKETKKVVEQFQLKYKNEVLKPWVDEGLWSSVDVPTGYVYKTTKRWINLLKCSLLNIPTPDLSEDRYPVMTGQATGGTEGQILGESTTTGTGQTLEQGTTSQEGATTGEENATQITGETKTTSNTWWVVLLAIVGVGFLLLAYWLAKKKKQNITV